MHFPICNLRQQSQSNYLIFFVTLQLIKLASSLAKFPATFDEKVLPYTQRNGQLIDQLGHIIKLDTLLSPKELETFTTKFEIFSRRKTQNVKTITFTSRTFCFPETCYGPYQYNVLSMAESGFDANLRTIVLISGFLTSDYVEWMKQVKDLWLELEDVNVIIVTWKAANRYIYSTAVADTPLVARQITIFLYYLAELNGFYLNDTNFTKRIHFVGHSLGAHVSGFVGQDLGGKLGRITGLDPAGPSFDLMARNHRLDLSDALLVDVIHTNSGKMRYFNAAATAVASAIDLALGKTPVVNKLTRTLSDHYTGEGDTVWYGIDVQIGHVDYYANNGRNQPGCSGMLRVCDHGRSYEIYEDMLRHEVNLRRHYHITHELINVETSQALERQKTWLKQNRLLAFNSNDYTSFLTGHNFIQHCPSIINGRSQLIELIDDSFRYCSIPIDLLTPVEELIEELKLEYNVSFEERGANHQQRHRYYFRTHSERPLVGDHNMLRIQLDKENTFWDRSCALELQVRMISGHEINSELNKEFTFVENDQFFGISMPFVNPVGYEARTALSILLMAIRNNQTNINDKQLINLISKVIPYEVELSITGSLSTGVFEAIKSRMWNLGLRNRASKNCRLLVSSVEVYPIIGYGQNVAGLYGSMGSTSADEARATIPVLTTDAHAALIKHPELLSANENGATLIRKLDSLVLG